MKEFITTMLDLGASYDQATSDQQRQVVLDEAIKVYRNHQQFKENPSLQGRLPSYTAYDVVRALVGVVEPGGDASVDGNRLANLKVLIDLIEKLLDDIRDVARDRNSQMRSVKVAGELAHNFLLELGRDDFIIENRLRTEDVVKRLITELRLGLVQESGERLVSVLDKMKNTKFDWYDVSVDLLGEWTNLSEQANNMLSKVKDKDNE